MRRHAIYSKTIGYPLIYRNFNEAWAALRRMKSFPDATLHAVYSYVNRESSMSDGRSAGPGGIFTNGQNAIVLGDAIE